MLLTPDVVAIRKLKAELHADAGDFGDNTPPAIETPSPEPKLILPSGIDFNCPVCTELLYKPVTTPCGHTFCKLCLDISFSYKRQCPMCREPFLFNASQVKTNVLLASILEQMCAKAYIERGIEAEHQNAQMRDGRKKVIIGNTHEVFRQPQSARNNHKWKFFVLVLDSSANLGDSSSVPSSYYIDKVEIFLHPTFTPNRLCLTAEPFEVKRVGWGLFTIRGTVFFKPQFNLAPMAFEHQLSFERNGTHRCFAVEFRTQSAAGTPTTTTPPVHT